MTHADVLLARFREVWLVEFQYEREPGERPAPSGLEARELRSGRRVRLGPGELASLAPSYPLGQESLFVAFDASGPLGCHLALGWPMPACVLDLHAEFRRLTSGRKVKGDYDLGGALAHLGLEGKGLDALAALLPVNLGHALLRRASRASTSMGTPTHSMRATAAAYRPRSRA